MVKVDTMISGAGIVLTEIFEKEHVPGKGFCNFLVRTDDNNIVRLQFWQNMAQDIYAKAGRAEIKGLRVGFRGRMSGVWQEKPTVVMVADGLRFG